MFKIRNLFFAVVIGASLGSIAGTGYAQFVPSAPTNQGGGGLSPAAPTQPTPVVVQAPPPETNVPSGGTIIGGILTAVVTTFGGILVSSLRSFLAAKTGIQLSDRFDDAIKNGMSSLVTKFSTSIDGKIPIHVKSEFVNDLITYLQTTIPDLIKQMGGNPTSAGFFAAVKARFEKFLLDPHFPVSVDPTPAPVVVNSDLLAQIKALFDAQQHHAS